MCFRHGLVAGGLALVVSLSACSGAATAPTLMSAPLPASFNASGVWTGTSTRTRARAFHCAGLFAVGNNTTAPYSLTITHVDTALTAVETTESDGALCTYGGFLDDSTATMGLVSFACTPHRHFAGSCGGVTVNVDLLQTHIDGVVTSNRFSGSILELWGVSGGSPSTLLDAATSDLTFSVSR